MLFPILYDPLSSVAQFSTLSHVTPRISILSNLPFNAIRHRTANGEVSYYRCNRHGEACKGLCLLSMGLDARMHEQ